MPRLSLAGLGEALLLLLLLCDARVADDPVLGDDAYVGEKYVVPWADEM